MTVINLPSRQSATDSKMMIEAAKDLLKDEDYAG